MIQVRFDLHTVWGPIDEGRHRGGIETDPVVVEVLPVDTLHHVASVLLASGLNRRLEGAVSALFGARLIGPLKRILGGNGGPRMRPIPRTALPRRVQCIESSVGEVIPIPITVVAAPGGITHDVGNVGDELRLLVKHHRQPHASVEGGVGRVEVIVPELVPRTVSIGR